MRILTQALQNNIASEVTTLASCWKITLVTEKVLGFTNCDHDLVIEGVLFRASTGFAASAIEKKLGCGSDNLEVNAIIDSEIILEEDILAGLYDFAELEIFLVDYLNIKSGKIFLNKGYFGEITLKNNQFTTEIRGITQKLSNNIVCSYSATCRAKFADKMCKINRNNYKFTGVIEELISNNQIFDSSRQEIEKYFNYGEIVITSGAMAGFTTEVKEYEKGKITLFNPLSDKVKIGDSYEIITGCDKNFSTCLGRFNKVINFRGEPDLPGLDEMLKTAGTYY